MSDYNTSIIAHLISEEHAQTATDKIIETLIAKQIINVPQTHCALSQDALAYPPGKNFITASIFQEEDARIMNLNYNSFSNLVTNGLQISIGHDAVFNPTGEGSGGRCPVCSNKSVDTQTPENNLSQAIEEWIEGKSEGLLKCEFCQQTSSISQWDFGNDMAFGNLIFTFWNWPDLSDVFISDISKTLGSRVQVLHVRI